MTDILVHVDNLSKKFCRSLKRSLWYGLNDLGSELIGRQHAGTKDLRPEEFWAVQNVNFELRRGECLGLIGRNGAGKTTLLRMLNGLIKPDQGRIEMRGRVGALIALGAGFNPILTGRENIYVNGAVLGLSKRDVDSKLEEIVEFAELSRFIDSPVQNYSSGMAVRLGFSIATAISPDVLILDEILAVGDAAFQFKCFNRIANLRSSGVASILVSHNMHQISRFASRAVYMDAGEVRFQGATESAIEHYLGAGGPGWREPDSADRRFQSGKIHVGKPRFLSDSLRHVASISNQDNVLIVVPYKRVKSNCNIKPVFEVVLRNAEGDALFQTTSRLHGLGPNHIPDEGVIEFSINHIPGNNLRLYLSVMVWDAETDELLFWQKGHPDIWIKGDTLQAGRIRFDINSVNVLPPMRQLEID